MNLLGLEIDGPNGLDSYDLLLDSIDMDLGPFGKSGYFFNKFHTN